jgi:anti-anti-sigma factor
VRQSWSASDGVGSSGADPSSEFRVEVEPDRDAVRVCPIGEIDLSTVGQVRAQLDELRSAGFSRLILDLRRATFLDSSGVRLALDAHTTAAAGSTEFATSFWMRRGAARELARDRRHRGVGVRRSRSGLPRRERACVGLPLP